MLNFALSSAKALPLDNAFHEAVWYLLNLRSLTVIWFKTKGFSSYALKYFQWKQFSWTAHCTESSDILDSRPNLKWNTGGVEVCECNLSWQNPSRIFQNLFTGMGKMVHILSSHGPLIHQLKPARPISAGSLRAFAAAPASTNTTSLCKECTSHVHQHLPQLCPGFSLKAFFSVPNLSSHQIELLEFSSELCPPSLHPVHP